MNEDLIYVYKNKKGKYLLSYPKYNIKTKAFIGKKGLTINKHENDLKTPIGTFELGIKLSMKQFSNCQVINKYMYWIDDSKSKYYNQLINITKIKKDWKSAEHLIEYKKAYKYLIEIKCNPYNIPYKGSAIFLHCKYKKTTHGCIAIKQKTLKKIIKLMDNNTKIIIS